MTALSWNWRQPDGTLHTIHPCDGTHPTTLGDGSVMNLYNLAVHCQSWARQKETPMAPKFNVGDKIVHRSASDGTVYTILAVGEYQYFYQAARLNGLTYEGSTEHRSFDDGRYIPAPPERFQVGKTYESLGGYNYRVTAVDEEGHALAKTAENGCVYVIHAADRDKYTLVAE